MLCIFFKLNAQISIQQIFDTSIKNHIVEIKSALNIYNKDTLYLICDYDFIHYDSSYIWNLPFHIKSIYRNEYNKWNRKIDSNRIIMYMESFKIESNSIKCDIYAGALFFNKKRKAIQVFSHNITKITFDCNKLLWIIIP